MSVLCQREKGEVVVQVDESFVTRISLPFESIHVRDGRITIELCGGNSIADIAYASIETLDELDGIEADRLTHIPDA